MLFAVTIIFFCWAHSLTVPSLVLHIRFAHLTLFPIIFYFRCFFNLLAIISSFVYSLAFLLHQLFLSFLSHIIPSTLFRFAALERIPGLYEGIIFFVDTMTEEGVLSSAGLDVCFLNVSV